MQAAVASVVGRVHMKERHKIQLALKFFKGKLTEYRSEERRKVLFSIHTVFSKYAYTFPVVKVLGHAPYKASCFQSTHDLAMQIMKQMHTPDDVDEDILHTQLGSVCKLLKFILKTVTFQCLIFLIEKVCKTIRY